MLLEHLQDIAQTRIIDVPRVASLNYAIRRTSRIMDPGAWSYRLVTTQINRTTLFRRPSLRLDSEIWLANNTCARRPADGYWYIRTDTLAACRCFASLIRATCAPAWRLLIIECRLSRTDSRERIANSFWKILREEWGCVGWKSFNDENKFENSVFLENITIHGLIKYYHTLSRRFTITRVWFSSCVNQLASVNASPGLCENNLQQRRNTR